MRWDRPRKILNDTLRTHLGLTCSSGELWGLRNKGLGKQKKKQMHVWAETVSQSVGDAIPAGAGQCSSCPVEVNFSYWEGAAAWKVQRRRQESVFQWILLGFPS